ncbi:MAG: CpXC domain-containing protein [Treponema sp.]|nr:CpXC domain-containing protein [Treponema sp.]
MIQKIPCFCDNTFSAEIPETVDLDKEPGRLQEILDGTFLNFICPACGKKHKPEFFIRVMWPSKKTELEVFTEMERGEFYRRKKEAPAGALKKETVIGYPELAERLMVLRDELEPAVVEALKYFLYLKAEEKYPDDEPEIWYNGLADGKSLEFHIHGLKKEEVAVMKIPFSLYSQYSDDYKKRPKSEIFAALKVRSYTSVKNTMRPEALK